MSVAVLVGLALIALATVAWTRATIALVRANPTRRVFGRGDQQWQHWRGSYFIGFMCGMLGCSQLDMYGWWGSLVGLAVLVLPPTVVVQMHNQRLPRTVPPA